MSVRGKRARAQPSPSLNQPTRSTDSQLASSALAGAQGALDECIGATSLIEVTLHSLESQVIACPEQEVLKRALQAMWSVHDWIYDLRLDDLVSTGIDRKDER